MSYISPKLVKIYGTFNGLTSIIGTDGQGNLNIGIPASGSTKNSFITNNSDSQLATNSSLVSSAFNYGYNPVTGFWERMLSGSTAADSIATSATGNQFTIAQMYGYNGTTFHRARLANAFKTVIATAAGNTAVWTPAMGNAWRLMGYTISVSGVVAATQTQVIELLDGATVIKNHLATVVSGTVSGDTQIGVDLGQGEVSAAVNNVLSINLSAAMVGGGVAINVWGLEGPAP